MSQNVLVMIHSILTFQVLLGLSKHTKLGEADISGSYETNAENTKFFIDASVNRPCTTDEFTSDQNLPRVLFRQVLNFAPVRFNDISFVATDIIGAS